MAEEQPRLSREEVREMIDAARERLDARRQEMARDNTEPLERVHVREREQGADLGY
jgi:hypothetical protein